ncbi:MAG: F-type H+-transporting ATPase subunit delta [Pirellulaceae bacterium]|jgi:F-type H+-transporting ATPase subunit delta
MTETPQHSTVFDTGQMQLATVYAKALLGAAGDSAESVVDEFDGFVELVAEIPALGAALASPRIPFEGKERIIDSALGGQISDVLLKFLKVTARRGRLNCLHVIHRALHDIFNKMTGRVEVTLKTAVDIDTQLISDLTTKLEKATGQKVVLKTTVDPELVGGIVIQIGDTVYDGSLANQLVKVRDKALHSTTQAIRSALERFTLAE